MIEIVRGDMLRAQAEALVNTVNCVGVMGRGIALQFKNRFPDNFEVYKAACDRNELQPGEMLVVKSGEQRRPVYVINFPTKRHWKGKSRLDDIRSGLNALVEEVRQRGIESIAIPPLGCGLGGLDWEVVRPMIEQAFADLQGVRVMLYEPAGAPTAADMAKAKKPPKMTEGRAALLVLVWQYLAAAMDPFITLLEIHKLMYFMQESGEPLRLKYAKAQYGPYAEALRHVLTRIEGHFITGYGDAEDDPTREIELRLDEARRAKSFLEQRPATLTRLERVAELIKGFESPYGMELLSTVHWVATRERASHPDEVVRKVHAWNDRKKRFPEKHILTALNALREQGWIVPAK